MKQRIIKPAKCECELLCAPIAPCEILRNGCPGSLTINGTLYAVSILGSLPAEGEPIVDGYRMTKENGESHDLCLFAGRVECSCGDYEFRRAPQQTAELMDCKHIKAVKQLLGLPRDQFEQAAYTGEYAVEFDDP